MKSYGFFSKDVEGELTEKERGILNYIELAIDSRDAAMLDKVNKAVIKYESDFILRLCRASNKFNNYCQKDKGFHKAIASLLRERNFISIEVHSIDNQEHLNYIDILLAVNYFSEYAKQDLPLIQDSSKSKARRTQCLNRSCEIGLYNALISRCDENALLWMREDLSAEDKIKVEETIWIDLNRLTNLYWGIGYIQAGGLLRDLAVDLIEIESEKNRAMTIYEEGIRKTLCAFFLEESNYSKAIEKCITQGRGYFVHYNNPKYHNWDYFKIKLCQWSGSNANYERLYKLAKQEIESSVPNNQDDSKLDF